MLPHDELLHYGVKGMRWGIRNKIAGAYEKSAQNKRKEASKAYNTAHSLRRTAKELDEDTFGSSPKKKGERVAEKALSGYFKLSAKGAIKTGKRLNREAKTQEAIAKKIAPAVKVVMNKTYDKKNQKRHLNIYQQAAIKIGVGAAGMAIGKLMGPTLESYGKSLAGKIGANAVKTVAANTDDIFKLASIL